MKFVESIIIYAYLQAVGGYWIKNWAISLIGAIVI